MAYSDAQKEATARYNKKAYDFISVVVPKGKRKRIADYAASQGKSCLAAGGTLTASRRRASRITAPGG